MKLFGGDFDFDSTKDRLRDLELELAQSDIWSKPHIATPLLKEKKQVDEKISLYNQLEENKISLEEWYSFALEEDSLNTDSLDALEEVNTAYQMLEKTINTVEIAILLNEKEDTDSAIIEIHPGAGGVESQDWAEMLLRMYIRWADRKNFSVSYLDLLRADEAGIKSVTLLIEGTYAYGLLKAEAGIHRLIRISPFDTSGRRHTSFASVDVLPDVEESIEIDILTEDLRIDVYRASGPGGQHVNKTNSAVRITHTPTGIVVQCQNEKSQLKNKESALKVLKARLFEKEQEKLALSRQTEYSSKDAIGFGSQIRTYTLQPYRLVKDHRCNFETANVESVLDGAIDDFIRNLLLAKHTKKNEN